MIEGEGGDIEKGDRETLSGYRLRFYRFLPLPLSLAYFPPPITVALLCE